MPDRSYDVVVVGGGPAGLHAAASASAAGANCMIVEREERLGGVLKQCIHDGFGVLEYGERLTGPEYAVRDMARVRDLGVPTLTGAFVHTLSRDADRWRLTLITPEEGVFTVDAASVVMATGCRERSDRQILLHGDRPAGIFTAGQAQRLINIDGVLPGRRVVILGSGDIGLIMARRFTLEGASVEGVYEIQSAPSGLARNVAQCLEDWDIPLHLRTTVTEVHGHDRVESVTVCPVDEADRPDRGRARLVMCDTLVISVGLIPENDILVDLGVALDPRTGGPPVNQHRESVVPGLFVCGNAVAVYDLVDYVSECGREAGHSAATRAASEDPGSHDPTSAAGEVPVIPGAGVAQLVPSRLDLSDEEPPVFFLRVQEPVDRAVIRVMAGLRGAGDEIDRRRMTYLRPPEMVRFRLSDEGWRRARERGCARGGARGTALEITVEPADGR